MTNKHFQLCSKYYISENDKVKKMEISPGQYYFEGITGMVGEG